MKLLNKFLLTLLKLTCAATISSCGAMTPEQQAQVNRQLGNAALRGNLQGVQQAIAAGADVHANNDDALQLAAVWEYWAVVEYLVRYGADQGVLPEYQRRDFLIEYILPELQTAVATNNWHRVEELLSAVPVKELSADLYSSLRETLIPAKSHFIVAQYLHRLTQEELCNHLIEANKNLNFTLIQQALAAGADLHLYVEKLFRKK